MIQVMLDSGLESKNLSPGSRYEIELVEIRMEASDNILPIQLVTVFTFL